MKSFATASKQCGNFDYHDNTNPGGDSQERQQRSQQKYDKGHQADSNQRHTNMRSSPANQIKNSTDKATPGEGQS